MKDQILMTLVALIIPLTTLGAGVWMRFFTPENHLFGYHTPMSEKNALTWEFANKFAGQLLMICSLVFIPVSLLVMLLVPNGMTVSAETVLTIVSLSQCVVLTLAAVSTEIALHRRFDKNGNPK